MDGPASVPVVDVHTHNFETLYPAALLAIRTASFIAIDAELSGIGERGALMSPSLDDRYGTIKMLAASRAMLSLGVSCFTDRSSAVASTEHANYRVQTFEFVMFCNEPYTVEPAALRFLNEHGFDFNKQIALGIPYRKGNDEAVPESKKPRVPSSQPGLRVLFEQLLLARKPIIVHNGWIDMAFLYACLYAELPPTLTAFVADLSEMFPAGIYDSKVIAEFHARDTSSFLEYLFHKAQRLHTRGPAGKSPPSKPLRLTYPDYSMVTADWVTSVAMPLPRDTSAPSIQPNSVCEEFASHGHCRTGKACKKSHDLDDILDVEEQAKSKRKRKRHPKGSSANPQAQVSSPSVDQPPVAAGAVTSEATESDENDSAPVLSAVDERAQSVSLAVSRSQGHRAGFDAFMTGFCFAHYQAVLEASQLANAKNKLFLSGKSFPMSVIKSQYTSTSQSHQAKQQRMQAS